MIELGITAQMLSLANVHPGGRYLVVDDGAGMVVAGVLERLGGALLPQGTFFIGLKVAQVLAVFYPSTTPSRLPCITFFHI